MFDTVTKRAYELGNSATLLTEFGSFIPDINYPNGTATKECEFVLSQMDQR